MKRKIIFSSLILFILGLVSCEKKPKLENKNLDYQQTEIVIDSMFNDVKLRFNFYCHDMVEDGEPTCNFFFYPGTYQDFAKEIESNEYFLEFKGNNIRFYYENQYFICQLVEQYGDCFYCKILSDYVIISEYESPQDRPLFKFALPFPRFDETVYSVAYTEKRSISLDNWDYLINYYNRDFIYDVIVTDNKISFEHFIDKNNNDLNIDFIKDNNSISIKYIINEKA